MGYGSTPEYTMQIYLTDKGYERLHDGGLKDGIKYFLLESDAGQYGKYKNLDYNYNGAKGGSYTTSADTETIIIEQPVPQLTGRVQSNTEVANNRILRTNTKAIRDVIPYGPDKQTSSTYELQSYKYNAGNKYFKLRNNGNPKYPIILGTRNIGSLTHESSNTVRSGYTSKTEPMLNTIASGTTPAFVGVSVTVDSFSKTEYQKFYIFNKSNKPVYIDTFGIKAIKPNTHFIGYVQDKQITNGNNTKSTRVFGINWDALDGEEYTDGELRVRTDSGIFNGSKSVLYPFEVLEVEVQYSVINAGSNKQHYRGQTNSSPDTKESTIEFILEMVTFKSKEKNESDRLTTSASVIVPVKDSGFDADSFNT